MAEWYVNFVGDCVEFTIDVSDEGFVPTALVSQVVQLQAQVVCNLLVDLTYDIDHRLL